MDKLCILCRRNTTYDHADYCPECEYDLGKAESRGFNAAIDKAVEVVTACGDDMPWYIWDAFVKGIIEELKKLKELEGE